jgi:hypothetical protein
MRFRDGPVAITALIIFSAWIFVALPFLYTVPRYSHPDDQTLNKCSTEESKNHGFWEKTGCDPVSYFTLWLVGFTGVLAVSTIGLWIVTWQSGKRQSRDMQESIAVSKRALTELEAPFITIDIVDPGIGRSDAKIGHDFMVLRFRIWNHGRTPASIIELVDFIKLRPLGSGLPDEVHPQSATRNTMPYGVIAPPSGPSQEWTHNLFAEMMNALAADPLPLKTQEVFFVGFVRYETIFGEVYRLGYCFMFDKFSNRWLLAGGDKHNYLHKESGPAA